MGKLRLRAKFLSQDDPYQSSGAGVESLAPRSPEPSFLFTKRFRRNPVLVPHWPLLAYLPIFCVHAFFILPVLEEILALDIIRMYLKNDLSILMFICLLINQEVMARLSGLNEGESYFTENELKLTLPYLYEIVHGMFKSLGQPLRTF